MKVLYLHHEDGSQVMVFIHAISTIHQDENGLTKINLMDGFIYVKETPNEIKLKIYG